MYMVHGIYIVKVVWYVVHEYDKCFEYCFAYGIWSSRSYI